jgi:hypothetical protein
MQSLDLPSLSSSERKLFNDYLDRAQNQQPITTSETIPLDSSNIKYNYQPDTSTMQVSDLAEDTLFNGSMVPLRFPAPRPQRPITPTVLWKGKNRSELKGIREELQQAYHSQDMYDKFYNYNPFRSSIKLSPLPSTLENHYATIEDANPSTPVEFGEDMEASVRQSWSIGEKHRQVDLERETLRQQREHQRQQREQEAEDQRFQAAEKERAKLILKEQQDRDSKERFDLELKAIRAEKQAIVRQAQGAEAQTKFADNAEKIKVFEEMDILVNSGKLPDLQTYNKLRQTFGAKAVGRMVNIGPVQAFIEQNRRVYKELQKLQQMRQESKASAPPEAQAKKTGIVRFNEVIAGSKEVTI